jgi:hypothetical protein
MTTFSTFPVVKAAVIGLISAAMPTVQVSYGPPTQGEAKREIIVIGDSLEWDQQWAVLGPSLRVDDNYAIECRIGVAQPGATSFQTTEERAFAIADSITGALRGIGTITGVSLLQPLALVRGPDFVKSEFSDDQGSARITWLEFGIQVRARI